MGCFRAHIQSRVLSHPVPGLYPLYFSVLLLLFSSVANLHLSYCFRYYYAISVVIVCCFYLAFSVSYCFLLLFKVFSFLLSIVVIFYFFPFFIICCCY